MNEKKITSIGLNGPISIFPEGPARLRVELSIKQVSTTGEETISLSVSIQRSDGNLSEIEQEALESAVRILQFAGAGKAG